jgi:general secretion pathway protein N
MRGRWFIAVLILALIALFPLRVALGMAGPGKIGLSADRVEGSIWRGSIHTLSIGPVVLGDVQTRLRPLFLLKGAIQSHFSRPGALDGDAYIGVNTAGVRGATGILQFATSFGPLPIETLDLSDVSLEYRRDHCAAASGRIAATLPRAVTALGFATRLTGTPKCSGDALALTLASQSGLDSVRFRLTDDGHYQAVITARRNDPAEAARLVVAGFAESPAGMVMRVTGSF